MRKKSSLFPVLVLFTALMPELAFAHTDGAGFAGGFMSGFLHPISGWDHVAAMVAVGLWGAFLGKPALFLLPIAFPLVMAFGGMLGVLGVPLPGVESGIAASSVVLGLLIAFAARAPLSVALCIVGAFAIFHGYAHGAELPEAASPIAYSIGFVLSTGFLHLAGIAIGMLIGLRFGRTIVRVLGAGIAMLGFGFLLGLV